MLFKQNTVPVAPLMGFPGAQLSGTTIKENLEDAATQVESLKSLYERYSPAAMFTMMDLTLEAEALGLRLLKPEDASYTVLEHPIEKEADLLKLKIPNPAKDARMPMVLDVVKRMHESFACLNIAYIVGPYTLAGLLNGASRVIKNVLKKPEFLKELLEITTIVIEEYAQALINAGADALCILEPTATLLSPAQFDEFSGVYVKRITDKCKAPVILHICGNTTRIINNMVLTKVDGLSLDSMVNFAEVKEMIPENMILMGNLDPVSMIAYGEKDVVKKNIRELLGVMKDKKNFVLSTGCDLPKDADLDNIQLMFELAKEKSWEE